MSEPEVKTKKAPDFSGEHDCPLLVLRFQVLHLANSIRNPFFIAKILLIKKHF